MPHPLSRRPWSQGRCLRSAALLLAAALVAAATSAWVPISLARFIDTAVPTASWTTDVLTPPTSLAAAGGTSAALTWVKTADAYATGYTVWRATASGGPYAQVATVTPRSVQATTDSPTVDGTYYYVLQSYFSSWTSVNSNQASSSIHMGLTGFRSCGSQLFDTGGDGNGYELNPANGCADDGAVATDANSGTGTGTSCTGAGKDNHRFWTFGLGLPASVASVNGISVKIKSAISVVTGTNDVCAQLSSNGGTTWTAAQQVSLTSTSLSYYTLGGAATLWGRTWVAADFADATFRVRLVDVANSTARTFTLDTVQVQVNYTP
jgi:hypothetical protein